MIIREWHTLSDGDTVFSVLPSGMVLYVIRDPVTRLWAARFGTAETLYKWEDVEDAKTFAICLARRILTQCLVELG